MVGKKTALASNEAVYSIGKEQREQTRKRRLAVWKVLESPSALLRESKESELENRHSYRQVASILNHQHSYWPESLTVGEVAKLQYRHSSNEASKFLKRLIGDCGDEFLLNKHASILTYENGCHFVTYEGIRDAIDWDVLGNCYRVIPSDLLAYLQKIDVKPTEHLLAWFAAAGRSVDSQQLTPVGIETPSVANRKAKKKTPIKERRIHNLKVWEESKMMRSPTGRFPDGITELATAKGAAPYPGEVCKRDTFVTDLKAMGVEKPSKK
jgi:hypothetical protein